MRRSLTTLPSSLTLYIGEVSVRFKLSVPSLPFSQVPQESSRTDIAGMSILTFILMTFKGSVLNPFISHANFLRSLGLS